MTNIDVEAAREMARAGYRWSGHTHPGTELMCLTPSDGDRAVLSAFAQTRSAITNSAGHWTTFERYDVYGEK